MKYFVKQSKSMDAEDWNLGIIPVEEKKLSRVSHKRSRGVQWLFILFSILLFLMFIRIVYMQTVLSDDFRTWADNNYLRVFSIPAPRGLIFDKTGKQLVENISENIIYIIPADIPRDPEEKEKFFTDLSFILSTPIEYIKDIVEKNKFSFTPIEIISGVSHEVIVNIEETFKNIPAVFASQRSTRQYRDDETYSHILGYVVPLNQENIDEYVSKGYTRDERIGATGIEKQYEDIFHGEPSRRIITIDAFGKIINEKSFKPSVPGTSLHLSIIDDLQEYMTKYLKERLRLLGKTSAVVIISNPNTGDIYGAVSLPNFNNNMFGDGIKGDEIDIYNGYISNKNNPLLNRITGGLYSPGSTFKIVTATAGLEKGVIDKYTQIYSPGYLTVQDKYDAQKKYIYKDWKSEGHGNINVVDALAESSDTFFYNVAGGYEDFIGLGINELASYSHIFGLGENTGIDIPTELSGVVPNPEWKMENKGTTWFTGDTYNLSIGQGYLLVTPIQVHTYMSIIAHNGEFVTPHFAKENFVYRKKLNISPETLSTIQQGLREVITSDKGTAKSLQYFPIELAGKTGTAQFNNNAQEHAWFTAYGPFDDPEVVITVLVEGGGEGSVVAVPIARDILDYYFSHKEKWN